MKALITGASSGIGRSMAYELSKRGYDLVLVARRIDRLEALQKEIPNVEIISLDISEPSNCFKLFNQVKNIDVLINNAGFGEFGEFVNTSLEKELNMIDTNIKAVHILSKLYLKEFKKKNKGYILNVASVAGFTSGPLMATYYASKNYVLALTEAMYEETRGSNIHISCLCPGPVNTEFNDVANVRFNLKSMTSDDVSKYAIKKMFQNKLIIIPGFTNKLAILMVKLLPRKLILRFNHKIQKEKEG